MLKHPTYDQLYALGLHGMVIPLAIAAGCIAVLSGSASASDLYAVVGAPTQTPPIGWVQFCRTYAAECDTKPLPPSDVVLSEKARSDLDRVNMWVNHSVKPMTDMDHYGMIQWWRYPDDGAGACHSYALPHSRMNSKPLSILSGKAAQLIRRPGPMPSANPACRL